MKETTGNFLANFTKAQGVQSADKLDNLGSVCPISQINSAAEFTANSSEKSLIGQLLSRSGNLTGN